MLLNRVIPFRQVDEVRLPAPAMPILSEDYLGALLSEKLKNKIPHDAYFVDTPYLPLNPMLGEDEVCMIDMSTSPATVSREPVRRTSWGEVPYSVWTIRLYLDINYQEIKEEVKKAFRAIIEGKRLSRTHY